MSDTVTISRAEYEALLAARDAPADIEAFDRAMARLASGDDELVPADVVKRILDGESPVRAFRELRGMSGAALAAAYGCRAIQFLDIESGRRQGSVATMKRLAAALGVAVDDLV